MSVKKVPKMTLKYVHSMSTFIDFMKTERSKTDSQYSKRTQNKLSIDNSDNDEYIMGKYKKKEALQQTQNKFTQRVFGKHYQSRSHLVSLLEGKQEKLQKEQEKIEETKKNILKMQMTDKEMLNTLEREFKDGRETILKEASTWKKFNNQENISKEIHENLKSRIYVDEIQDKSQSMSPFSTSRGKQIKGPIQQNIWFNKGTPGISASDEYYRILQTFGKPLASDKLLMKRNFPSGAQKDRKQPSQMSSKTSQLQQPEQNITIVKAKAMLSDRSQRQQIYQQHIDHEKDFLKQNNQYFNPPEDDNQDDNVEDQQPREISPYGQPFRNLKGFASKRNIIRFLNKDSPIHKQSNNSNKFSLVRSDTVMIPMGFVRKFKDDKQIQTVREKFTKITERKSLFDNTEFNQIANDCSKTVEKKFQEIKDYYNSIFTKEF